MIFGIIGILLLAGVLLGMISWGWGVLGAMFLYWPASRFWTKYKAASNAILARHTFDLLSDADRKKVLAAVSAIMSNAKYPSQDPEQELINMASEQRYGFIALGMARIGIAPKIGGGWYEVHNPYAEILGAHREIAFVKHQIRLRYGVDVNFGDVVASTVQRSGLVPQDLTAVQRSKQPAQPKDNDAILRQARGVLDCKTTDQGEANAQFQLGDMYEQGQGVPQDYEEAVKWYRLAADQGNAYAQVNLGTMYDNGTGVPQGDEEAVKWYRLAAEQNDADGQSNLGMMYEHGQGVPQDYEEAVKWYRLAVDQGNANAQDNLGNMYYYGRGVPQDAKEAVKWYRLAADQGNADAQVNLGGMYYEGKGVPQDYEEAAKWYRLAADQGNDLAQLDLAVMCVEGKCAPQDRKEIEDGIVDAVRPAGTWPTFEAKPAPQYDNKAVYSLCKSAEQGDAEEQLRLGDMYSGYDGFEKNDEQAAYWYRKAAEQGGTTGQWKLGDMYREGRGVVQDDEQAVNWFRKAAEQQDDIGQLRLGDMYREGRGVEQNYEQAMYWYLKAAEQGTNGAPKRLGDMYKEGRGVAKNIKEANYWYSVDRSYDAR